MMPFMSKMLPFRKGIIAFSLLSSGVLLTQGSAQAAFTTFTNQAAFNAAIAAIVQGSTYTESFGTIPASTATTFSGVSGSPNPGFNFSFAATAGSGNLVSNPAGRLATAIIGSTITLNFTASATPIQAVGGLFGVTNNGGQFGGGINLVATDVNNLSSTLVGSGTSATSFFGFISNGPLLSRLVVTPQDTGNRTASIDHLQVASLPSGPLPVPGPLSVPGPLPVLGVIAAAGGARRLRKRCAARRTSP
jgi:hypothetical protein